jgi:PAS domain S-box-containing protein
MPPRLSTRQLSEIFTEMAEVSSDVFWVVDDVTAQTLYVSPAFLHVWGYPPEEVIADPTVWSRGVHPDDRERADLLFKSRQAVDRYDHTFRVIRPDGSIVWVRDRGWRVSGNLGNVRLFAGIAEDVTDVVRARQQQDLLASEVDHRAKNILSVVQALVRQAKAGATSIDEYAESIGTRIRAIARTHDLLRERNWQGAYIRELVRDEIGPYSAMDTGTSVVVDGPNIMLTARASAALGLVLHELVTNAVKYGALSPTQGSVSVRWENAGPHVALFWRECLDQPSAEPLNKGFGSRLIEKLIGFQLGGSTAWTFDEAGVSCEIRIPGEHVLLHGPAA